MTLALAACGTDSTAATPVDTDAADVATTTTMPPVLPAADGAALYESNCSRCHQSDGSGRIGPNIQGVTLTEFVERNVRTGPGAMPAFPELSDAEVAAITSHVVDTL